MVGAQAVYLRTGIGNLAVIPFTVDADLALDPALLAGEPLIEAAMASGGFTQGVQPGSWLSPDRIPIDLLVAASVAGHRRRSVEMPPHDRRSARRTDGLEGALVDRTVELIAALDSDDPRSHRIGVAGPAALLVAKAHKLGERTSATTGRDRTRPKDALDIHRLMLAYDTEPLAERFTRLKTDERSRATTEVAIVHLDKLFVQSRLGAELAADALGALDDREQVIDASVALVRRLLERVRTRS